MLEAVILGFLSDEFLEAIKEREKEND